MTPSQKPQYRPKRLVIFFLSKSWGELAFLSIIFTSVIASCDGDIVSSKISTQSGKEAAATFKDFSTKKADNSIKNQDTAVEREISTGTFLEDEAWFLLARNMQVPRDMLSMMSEEDSYERLKNLGVETDENGSLRRRADAASNIEMVNFSSQALPNIDCIAITSIDRHNNQAPYIYQTLTSLFDTLSDDVHVNIMVGNDDDEYVRPESLIKHMSSHRVNHVHIWPTSSMVADYIQKKFEINRRGGWNYGRLLRSYHGDKGLLVLEDDVVWAEGSSGILNSFVNHAVQEKLMALSLYNRSCAGADIEGDVWQPHVSELATMSQNFSFTLLQGMYFSPSTVNALGRFLQLRIHTRAHDFLVGEFAQSHRLRMGMTMPSLVQHIGRKSTGLCEGFHESPCFVPSFLPHT